nr:hypothetical transcript [Hymenolepis microstoma]
MFLCLKRDQRLRVFAYPSKYTILGKSVPVDTVTISREKASDFRETNQVALVTVGPKDIQKFMCYKEGDIDVNNYFICFQCPKGIRIQRLNSWYTIRTVKKTIKDSSRRERGVREYRQKDIFGDTSDITSSDESVKSQPRKRKRRVPYVSSSELSSCSSRSASPSKIPPSSPMRDRLYRQRVKPIFGNISDTGSSDESEKSRKTLSAKKRKQSPSDFTSLKKKRRKLSKKTSDYSSDSPVGNKVKSSNPVCLIANTESESTGDALPPSGTKRKKPSIEHKSSMSKAAASEGNKVGSLTPMCSDEENTSKRKRSNEDTCTDPPPKRPNPGGSLKKMNQEE